MLRYQTNSLSEEEMYRVMGQNIFYYRLRENLTISGLSEKIASELTINIPEDELKDIEIGNAIMEVGRLSTIAEVLEIGIEKLVHHISFYEFLTDFGKDRVERSLLKGSK